MVAIEQSANLGDVVCTLPLAGALKQRWPGVRILMIARQYARALVEACVNVDAFIDAEQVLADPMLLQREGVEVFLSPYLEDRYGEAARAAGVPLRVGNLRRPRTLRWANRYIVQGSKSDPRHVANLNLRFLRPLGLRAERPPEEMAPLLGLQRLPPACAELAAELDPARFNLILHPKSNKNGREWPAAHFERLAALLPQSRYRIFLTGRAPEREELLRECPALFSRPGVVDLMGRMDLAQLIWFVSQADGMIASGTGPLHMAGALGIHALGLFPGRNRSNPRRWRPLGVRAEALCIREDCEPGPGRCPKDYAGEGCPCMTGITPEMVAQRVEAWSVAKRTREHRSGT